MTVIDITRPLDAVAPWPGEQGFHRELTRTHAVDGWEVARLTLGSHLGTHLDAPAHLLPAGARLGEFGLDPFVGPAVVVDCAEARAVGPRVLDGVELLPGDRVLLKTRNSFRDAVTFNEDFCHPTPALAERLLSLPLSLLGVDGPSVDSFSGEPAVHRLLFTAGLPALENVDLSRVTPGRYRLICLPLSIPAAEGSPCRAVLLRK
ncbi:MAG: cyclase family protein [Candidatus Coatesbacteria bacterium]|nr:cyclase family protein [Candidatus Coatesbacteria bacterium]